MSLRPIRRIVGAAFVAAAALLAGCATTTPGGVPIDTSVTAIGQDSRVEFLILHYTALDMADSLKELSRGGVSAHYLVTDENPPRIMRLVRERRRAWQAGVSYWRGNAMLNSSSIGIEIVNRGWTIGPDGQRVYAPYSEAQIDTLIPLIRDIVERHQIQPDRILGHSDIAPQRKQDPGPLFPWKRLGELGIIPWPDPTQVAGLETVYAAALPDATWFQQQLARLGFQITETGEFDEPTRNVIAAFQMKYRPARYDGQADPETAALLQVVNSISP
ncbi:MAG: N-acetylmuramoyl-L-alanine amidase [Rubrivivax sp. SCN 70-15]|jgi:N-acetylmuramoyl-L-alanine amidase|nr:MAG: N-acetylmuramoyl-L-alanine amidase [Rubrivivax sp. SCN 70-15]